MSDDIIGIVALTWDACKKCDRKGERGHEDCQFKDDVDHDGIISFRDDNGTWYAKCFYWQPIGFSKGEVKDGPD